MGGDMEKLGVRIYGLGALALGIIGLVFGGFALQWQPVPDGVPYRTILAYVSAGVLAVAGASLIVRKAAGVGAWALTLSYLIWLVALHGPRVVASPLNVSVWLGFAEILTLACGGLAAVTQTASLGGQTARAQEAARLGFGAALLVFGLSHFVYAKATAGMVPAWIPPGQRFWAYATGACHLLAGLSLLSGVQARIAAWFLTAMFSGFVILLHAPRVFQAPASRMEWTMLAIALSLTGAAWTLADMGGGGGKRRR
jgi:uncharacterized membrane protein YphA (DoxX/SURF4 family)